MCISDKNPLLPSLQISGQLQNYMDFVSVLAFSDDSLSVPLLLDTTLLHTESITLTSRFCSAGVTGEDGLGLLNAALMANRPQPPLTLTTEGRGEAITSFMPLNVSSRIRIHLSSGYDNCLLFFLLQLPCASASNCQPECGRPLHGVPHDQAALAGWRSDE